MAYWNNRQSSYIYVCLFWRRERQQRRDGNKFIAKSSVYDKEKSEPRGGTLPAGHYLCHYVAAHQKFHECIWLERCSDAAQINLPFSSKPINHYRGNDFFIHGIVKHGCDGCIVPASPGQRKYLNKAIKNFDSVVYVKVTGVGFQLQAERMDGMLS